MSEDNKRGQPSKPDSYSSQRGRARPVTPADVLATRKAVIEAKMRAGEWQTGASGHALALEWGVSPRYVRYHANEISKVLRPRGAPEQARLEAIREQAMAELDEAADLARGVSQKPPASREECDAARVRLEAAKVLAGVGRSRADLVKDAAPVAAPAPTAGEVAPGFTDAPPKAVDWGTS